MWVSAGRCIDVLHTHVRYPRFVASSRKSKCNAVANGRAGRRMFDGWTSGCGCVLLDNMVRNVVRRTNRHTHTHMHTPMHANTHTPGRITNGCTRETGLSSICTNLHRPARSTGTRPSVRLCVQLSVRRPARRSDAPSPDRPTGLRQRHRLLRWESRDRSSVPFRQQLWHNS